MEYEIQRNESNSCFANIYFNNMFVQLLQNGHDYCKTEPTFKGDEPCTSITMNAYIENSGSIDGYVNGGTLFKTDLYAMLTDGNVGKVTFNYVNDKIYPQQCNARDFIMNVTPTTFKTKVVTELTLTFQK